MSPNRLYGRLARAEDGYHDEALQLLSHVDRGDIVGLIAPVSFSTCWYGGTFHHNVDPRPLFETVETAFRLAPMNRIAPRRALEAGSETDFKDAYLAETGGKAEAEIILIRNEQYFAESPLTPYRPEVLLTMLRR